MAPSCHLIGPGFVGEVDGVDITRPLSKDDAAFLQDAIDRHGVLVFHDQPLTDDQQVVFSRSFGELELSMGRLRALATIRVFTIKK